MGLRFFTNRLKFARATADKIISHANNNNESRTMRDNREYNPDGDTHDTNGVKRIHKSTVNYMRRRCLDPQFNEGEEKGSVQLWIHVWRIEDEEAYCEYEFAYQLSRDEKVWQFADNAVHSKFEDLPAHIDAENLNTWLKDVARYFTTLPQKTY